MDTTEVVLIIAAIFSLIMELIDQKKRLLALEEKERKHDKGANESN